AWFDLEEILVVVAVVGWGLMHRGEPEHVAAEACDVVEVIANAVERPAIERRRRSRSGQRATWARKAVDHQLIDHGVAGPVWRVGAGPQRELLAARRRVRRRGPEPARSGFDPDLVASAGDRLF